MFNSSAKLHQIGRFEAIRLIGFGGVGVVFEARDPILGRRVALKLCKDAGPSARAALCREATVLARLSHPNVVTVHEFGEHHGEVFYAMELVEGRSAHAYFRECGRWQDAVEVYVAAGLGLIAAHERGIVHGDFKPANVLIGADGRVRVADFGLARLLAEHDPRAQERLGTLAFMAPERLRGELGDPRSDQFSYCVALWQLLFGVRPFHGETRAELLASIEARERRTAEALPRIPRRLRAIVERGLAVEPDDRYPDMRALVSRLTGVFEAAGARRLSPLGLVGLAGVLVGGTVDRTLLDAPCEGTALAANDVGEPDSDSGAPTGSEVETGPQSDGDDGDDCVAGGDCVQEILARWVGNDELIMLSQTGQLAQPDCLESIDFELPSLAFVIGIRLEIGEVVLFDAEWSSR